MPEVDHSSLTAALEQLQRDWPLLVADDDDLGERFLALFDDEDLGAVLADFMVPAKSDSV